MIDNLAGVTEKIIGIAAICMGAIWFFLKIILKEKMEILKNAATRSQVSDVKNSLEHRIETLKTDVNKRMDNTNNQMERHYSELTKLIFAIKDK